MQRTVNPAAVTPMAPPQRYVTLERDSVNAKPMFRGSAVMSVSLKPSACNWEGAVFRATATLSGLNRLTVKRVDSAGASLE